MSLDLLILRAMNEHGWGRKFATEYVMNRHIHGLGHERAYNLAMENTMKGRRQRPAIRPRTT